MEKTFVPLAKLNEVFGHEGKETMSQIALQDDGSCWLEVYQDGKQLMSEEIANDRWGLSHTATNKLYFFIDAGLIDELKNE